MTDPRRDSLLGVGRLFGGLIMFVIEAGIVAGLLLFAFFASLVILALL